MSKNKPVALGVRGVVGLIHEAARDADGGSGSCYDDAVTRLRDVDHKRAAANEFALASPGLRADTADARMADVRHAAFLADAAAWTAARAVVHVVGVFAMNNNGFVNARNRRRSSKAYHRLLRQRSAVWTAGRLLRWSRAAFMLGPAAVRRDI